MEKIKEFLINNRGKYRLQKYEIKTVDIKYGEYFVKVKAKPGYDDDFNFIFTQRGILYKVNRYETFLEYENIGDINTYSINRGAIISKDHSKIITLSGVDFPKVKEALEEVVTLNKYENNITLNKNKSVLNVEININTSKDNKIEINWSKEINKKVQNFILIKNKLELLKNESFFKQLNSEINQKIENIDKYISKVRNPIYQIAIVGAIKAGKSSLINALLEEDIVSVDVTPETATLTKFRYSPINFLNVKFYTEKEWNKIWEETNLQQDKAQGEKYLSEYRSLRADEIKSKYLNKENIYLEFNTVEEIKKEIEKWTSSKHREHFFVKELEIGLSKLNLPEQVCLVDTPGLNDISKYRSDITKRYIDSANAVLICINCKTLRNEEYIVINQIFNTKYKFKDKIYILGTQKDIFKDTSDWSKQKKDWIKNLKINFENDERITEDHILGISSYISRCLITLREGKTDRKLENELNSCGIISDDEADYLIDLRRKEKEYDKKIIEKIIKKASQFSNIEYLKNTIIAEKLLSNWNIELIEKFEQDYKLILEEIMNFIKKNTKDIKNNIDLLSSEYFDKQHKLNESFESLKKIVGQKNELNKEIAEIEKEFSKEIKEFKEQILKLNSETFK